MDGRAVSETELSYAAQEAVLCVQSMNAGNREAWGGTSGCLSVRRHLRRHRRLQWQSFVPVRLLRSARGGALAITFTPQDTTFAAATAEYRQVWADEGPRITEAMERLTRLGFVDRQIDAIVFEGVSRSGSRDVPMSLRASYPLDTKKSALVHELGQALSIGKDERASRFAAIVKTNRR